MAKLVMDRKASDNKYLHRDFHCSMDVGINYVATKYGDNGAKEYLTDFAKTYYAPLIEDAKKRGMIAIKEHIENIYEIEEASEVLSTELTDTELRVKVSECPAIRYFKKCGHKVSPYYVLSTSTVNETIATEANLGFQLISYDPEDGKAEYRFFKR